MASLAGVLALACAAEHARADPMVTAPPVPSSSQCDWAAATGLGGRVVATLPAATREECCGQCFADAACRAADWNNRTEDGSPSASPMCHLKDCTAAACGMKAEWGYACTPQRAPTPPAPPAPPAPPGVGCATDADCPFDGPFRCCGTVKAAENCPKPTQPAGAGATCTLPGAAGVTTCHCTSMTCTATTAAREQGMKQWLVIGDSISGGVCNHQGDNTLPKLAAKKGIQVVKIVGNGANVWWGAHCLDAFLGSDPSRWDIITYQFGLHDLALDNERVEPGTTYARQLANITARLAAAAPRARISWVTTTPVPKGIDGACVGGEGGCPPRRQADPPLYNAAAAKVVAAHNAAAGAANVSTIDLYAVVTGKCGESYTRCPEGCTGKDDCFQLPANVHFAPAGWDALAEAYMAAANDL